MVWLVKGFTIAPIYFYRSPLPVQTIQGVDANLNGENNDLPGTRLQVHGVGEAAGGHRRLRDLELQPRRVAHADEPARLARLRLFGSARIEAIGEIFNLFNAKNPALHDRQQPDRAPRSCSRTRLRATSSSPSSASARSASASRSSPDRRLTRV